MANLASMASPVDVEVPVGTGVADHAPALPLPPRPAQGPPLLVLRPHEHAHRGL